MSKRDSKPASAAKRAQDVAPSKKFVAHQKLMHDALTPKLNARQKRKLQSLIKKYARQGMSKAQAKSTRWDKTLWWWKYVYDPRRLTTAETLTAEAEKMMTEVEPLTGEELTSRGKEIMAGFNLTAAEVKSLKLATPYSHQYSAFVYEMAVRLVEPDLIPVPWIKLPYEDQLPFLDSLLRPNFLTGIFLDEPLPADSEEHWHWTRPAGNRIFNLLHSDTRLANTFLTFVRWERKRLGIPSSDSKTGMSNKPLSWAPIESVDLRRLGNKPMNSSERSHFAQAKAEVSSLLGIADAMFPRRDLCKS